MPIDALTTVLWRWGIAFVIAADAVQLAVRTTLRADLGSAPLPVPATMRALGQSPPLLALLALITVGAAFGFGRGRRPVLFGVIALACLRLILEAFGALDGIYDETSYHAAAALLGWLLGIGFARAVGMTRENEPREVEAWAALGAAAMFGATYLNAGTSKLLNTGGAWTDADVIRLMVASHHPVGRAGFSDAVAALIVGSPFVGKALSVGTLIIQCGAVVFPWTARTRALWGTLFLSFHVGIYLSANSIFFAQAAFLDVMFAWPWAVWLAKTGVVGAAPIEVDTPFDERRLARAKKVGAAVAAFLVLLLVLPRHPRRHPIERLSVNPGSEAPKLVKGVRALGPVTAGMELSDGWTVKTIDVEKTQGLVTISRAQEQLVLVVSTQTRPQSGRHDRGNGFHVSYRPTPVAAATFANAEGALSKVLVAAAGRKETRAALEQWLSEARETAP